MDGLQAFFKGIQLLSAVSNWSTKALADGKVTLREVVNLAEQVCPIIGVPLELDLTGTPLDGLAEKAEPGDDENDRPKRSWE